MAATRHWFSSACLVGPQHSSSLEQQDGAGLGHMLCCCAAPAVSTRQSQDLDALPPGVDDSDWGHMGAKSHPTSDEVVSELPAAIIAADPRTSPREGSREGASEGVAGGGRLVESVAPEQERRAVSAWREQVGRVIQPGAKSLVAGWSAGFGAFFKTRRQWSLAVMSFLFPDGKALGSEAGGSPSPGGTSSETIIRTVTSASMTSSAYDAEMAEVTSLRLSKRAGQDLQIEHSCEECAAGDPATEEKLGPGDCEVLLTSAADRVRVTEGSLIRARAGSGSPTDGTLSPKSNRSRSSSNGGSRVYDYALIAQVEYSEWVFPALVRAVHNGPISRLVREGIPCHDVLIGLSEAWPGTAGLFRKALFESENASLHTERKARDCMLVELRAPLDLNAVAANYSSAAKLLRILRSARLRFIEPPPQEDGDATAPKAGNRSRASRQGLLVTYQEGEWLFRFLVHNQSLVWADESWAPLLTDAGEVAIIPSPIAGPEGARRSSRLSFHCKLDNLKLKLSDFGCIGFSSLPMPDTVVRLDIITAPLAASEGYEAFAANPDGLIADVVVQLVELGAFPAEMAMWPFFDVRLMRLLLQHTFEAVWSFRPNRQAGGWRMVNAVRMTLPSVAKAFKLCFKAFVKGQMGDSDVLKLLADFFAALAEDLGAAEAAACKAAAGAAAGGAEAGGAATTTEAAGGSQADLGIGKVAMPQEEEPAAQPEADVDEDEHPERKRRCGCRPRFQRARH